MEAEKKRILKKIKLEAWTHYRLLGNYHNWNKDRKKSMFTFCIKVNKWTFWQIFYLFELQEARLLKQEPGYLC